MHFEFLYGVPVKECTLDSSTEFLSKNVFSIPPRSFCERMHFESLHVVPVKENTMNSSTEFQSMKAL